MQMSNEFNDIGVSPSFNWYSTDNSTSNAALKVSREIKQEQQHDVSDIEEEEEEEDFEFSLEFDGEKFSTKDLELNGRILLPIFNTDLVTKDEAVDNGINGIDIDNNVNSSSSLVIPLEKLLISNESSSYSSSEADDQLERDYDDDKVSSSGTFCVTWRKSEAKSQNPDLIKKSKSTGTGSESGSRRWKIKDILRRSNSAGKETVFFLCPKRVEASNKKRVVSKGDGKMKKEPSIHELFYVQKRAELKGDKKKSYLPYRQDLLGFKVHVVGNGNGNGNANKKLPF